MRRYIIRSVRPRAWADDDAFPLLPHLTVYEPDNSPTDTGLVDHHGHAIMAVHEMEPIGFVALGEAD